jgi:hypothetical protein
LDAWLVLEKWLVFHNCHTFAVRSDVTIRYHREHATACG